MDWDQELIKVSGFNKTASVKEGDKVKYIPKEKGFGLEVSGLIDKIDQGYRAYIISDKDIKGTGIKKGDKVKVLLREGELKKVGSSEPEVKTASNEIIEKAVANILTSFSSELLKLKKHWVANEIQLERKGLTTKTAWEEFYKVLEPALAKKLTMYKKIKL